MKVKILILGFLLVAIVGCSPKAPSSAQVIEGKKVTQESMPTGEGDVVLPTLTPDESKESARLIKQLEGTYLPVKYVESVSKSLSHLQAMRQVLDSTNTQVPSALVVEPENLTKLYNFHEGVTETIYRVEPNKLSTINGPKIEYAISENNRIHVDGIEYVSVSNSIDSEKAISNFIVQKRIGVVDLVGDGSSLKSDAEGNLILDNNAVNIGLDLILSQAEFDWVRIDGKIVFLAIQDDQIDILSGHLKDGSSDWEFLQSDAIFKVEKSYKPRT